MTTKFVDNKYQHWYYDIINKAISLNRKKNKTEYFEIHHIVPKCLGGDNAETNMVLLTAREHFICHWLLVKFTTGFDKRKMMKAMSCFMRISKFHNKKITSRQHEIAKKFNNEAMVGKQNPSYGKRGILSFTFGRKLSLDHIAKTRSGAKKWRENGGITEEYKKKISDSMLGKPKSKEMKEKLAISISGENSHHFKGYYKTPFGNFAASHEGGEFVPGHLICKWCKNSERIITKQCFVQSSYLRSLGNTIIGKTFKEIGFYFDPIHK